MPVDWQVLLARTATAAATRMQPALQKAAQGKVTSVPALSSIDSDAGGKKDGDGLPIEVTQVTTQQNE